MGMSKEDAEGVAAARFPGRNISLSQDEDVLDTWCVCARVRACMLDCVVLLRARARMCVCFCVHTSRVSTCMHVDLAVH